MRRDAPPLAIAEITSFHVGGTEMRLQGLPPRMRVSTPGGPVHAIDPNGEVMAEQMYVQAVRLAAPKTASPVLLWHGGGLTETASEARLADDNSDEIAGLVLRWMRSRGLLAS